MLKSRITRRLNAYFAVVLLAFSLVVGSVFLLLFRQQAMEVQRDELQRYAQSLADILSGSDSVGMGMRGGMGGSVAYLRFIGKVSGADVWIVDQNGEPVQIGMSQMMQSQTGTAPLPDEAQALLERILAGTPAFAGGTGALTGAACALTVGVPIALPDGTVLGAVLLRSQADHADSAVRSGLLILSLSILVAICAAALLSARLSGSFTKPLSKLKTTACALAGGDYGARSGIVQNDEIGELAATLDMLAMRLSEASREQDKLEQMRRDFTANISHELRTPVTVLRGSLEALCDGVVCEPDKVDEYHRQMLSESKHLERLVNDLLELSRLQNADFSIEMTQISLSDALADAVRSASRLAQSKGVRVELTAAAPLPPFWGDYGRLRQMFLTVLDNAVKFSPPQGAVRVLVQQTQIVIQDAGPGIGAEQLPHLFDRFYRTRSAQNASGTGLGLAIAGQIAARHGIAVRAANRPEGGAEFTFSLPEKGFAKP